LCQLAYALTDANNNNRGGGGGDGRHNHNYNNNNDNVYGAVITAEPLREFTRFIC